MRTSFFLALVAALVAVSPAAAADDPAARAIMEKVDARDDGDNASMNTTMILFDRHGGQRIRQLRQFVKDFGPDVHRLMFFLAPADVKGVGFLTFDYDDPSGDDDQWLYLPALKKTKRIASSDKSGSFMGSDFSYADMTRPDLENYDYAIAQEAELRGNPVWVILATPRSKEIVETYGYAKSALFVRKDIAMVVRAKHWLAEGGKEKYFDIVDLKLVDGIWVGVELTMTTKRGAETLSKTALSLSDVRFGQSLEESMFSIRRLEQGL
jgi:outer membrane lipoprotein-sorting protein